MTNTREELEKVVKLPIKEIFDFPDHPFKVRQNEEMNMLIESVKKRGVLFPALVRERQGGGYEMISGHRRKFASELAGLKEMECIIRNVSDDEATILMVDSNLQREEVLPSEKAFAYKMRVEAENRQGKRSDLTLSQDATKLKGTRATGVIEKATGESKDTIYRYIRLTELIPDILKIVDDKKIAFTPAVALSYLKKEEQYFLLDIMQFSQITPSQSQALEMKRLSQAKKLSAEKIHDIMSEEKANQIPTYKFNANRLDSVLPLNMTRPDDIENFIIRCIQEHNKRQQNKSITR